MAGLGPEVVGTDLMNRAFADNGPLADLNAPKAEREGLKSPYRGATSVFKNPASHRDSDYDDPVLRPSRSNQTCLSGRTRDGRCQVSRVPRYPGASPMRKTAGFALNARSRYSRRLRHRSSRARVSFVVWVTSRSVDVTADSSFTNRASATAPQLRPPPPGEAARVLPGRPGRRARCGWWFRSS